jgi:hypothetical protein
MEGSARPPPGRPKETSLSPRPASTRRILRLFAVALLVASSGALVPLAATPAAASGNRPVAPRHRRPRPATPTLIARAVAGGHISQAQGAVLLTHALTAPDRLPAAYRSPTPWDGTVPLLQLQRTASTLGEGPAARAVRAGLRQVTNVPCPGVSGTLPALRVTTHFYIEYRPAALTGLGIGAYASALEHVWSIEVDSFGWAAPPRNTATPATGGRYPVRIQQLGTGLYGYVTRTRTVGNNPHTPWADRDAMASCMVLNQNYVPFPGTPITALHATAAHEFNHSLQFGYGALSGPTNVREVWVEGGATWMEDEVFNAANDNYNYLWPSLRKPMPLFDPSFPYPYWVVFRAMTEPFGTGTAGGGQRIFRSFWEQLSRNTATNTTAFRRAFASVGGSLATAYHDAGIALRYDVGCGGATAEPYCLKEGPAYVSAQGAPPADTQIANPGDDAVLTVANDFATRWVDLPAGHLTDVYPVSVDVDPGDPGRLMVSLVCLTGSDVTVTSLGTATEAAGVTTSVDFVASACDEATAVVSNFKTTSATPVSKTTSGFTISTA